MSAAHKGPWWDDECLQDSRVRTNVEGADAEELRGGQDDGERLQGALHVHGRSSVSATTMELAKQNGGTGENSTDRSIDSY
jgi:hypothetical protein